MQSALGHWDWRTDKFVMESDPTKITEALTDFNEIITSLLVTEDIVKAIGVPDNEVIAKAGKKISTSNMEQIKLAHESLGKLIELDSNKEEDEEVKKEDIEKMIREAVAKAVEPLTKKLDTIEKEDEGVFKSNEEEEGNITDSVAKAIEKAIAPLVERVDKVEKARGISRGQEIDPEGEEIKKSVWDGLL